MFEFVMRVVIAVGVLVHAVAIGRFRLGQRSLVRRCARGADFGGSKSAEWLIDKGNRTQYWFLSNGAQSSWWVGAVAKAGIFMCFRLVVRARKLRS